jgi:hypothetical protein
MQGDNIGFSEKVIQVAKFNAQLSGSLLRDEWVAPDNPHPEGFRVSGNLRSNSPQPDDADGFALKLGADKFCAFPFPVA